MKMKTKFYDTCSLLVSPDNIFQEEDTQIAISSITLEELENIKTAYNKDAEVKYSARKVLKLLEEYYGNYLIEQFTSEYDEIIAENNMPLTNDSRIIIGAIKCREKIGDYDMVFVTNDLSCKHLARVYYGDNVESVVEEKYNYDGYKEVYLNEEEMSEFYTHPEVNTYELFINQYLLIYDADTEECVDRVCWTGSGYRRLKYDTFSSYHFGDIKPMKGDVYQQLLADSLTNNKITMVKGPAGTGKTYMSIGYLMHLLSIHKIDKIIIFCNTVATKGAAKLGFYPGTRDEKLLDSQIGNLLASKFGDRYIVEQMINENKLVLLPMSDIRGYDTSGMKAGIYISEAQNLDIDLMKLTLQRIGEDSVCIIDGDCKAQVDDIAFAGNNNGMKRASKVFRGSDIYGEITLKNIHRSKIAMLAEGM